MVNPDDRDRDGCSSCCSSNNNDYDYDYDNLAELDDSHAKKHDDDFMDTITDPRLHKKMAAVEQKVAKQKGSECCNITDETPSKCAFSLSHAKQYATNTTAAAAAAANSDANVARGSRINTNKDADTDTDAGTDLSTKRSMKLAASNTSSNDHETETNESSSASNSNPQSSIQSDAVSKEEQQQIFLRTTPGAFAINNPFSSSSEISRLEQRQSILVGVSFTSTVLTSAASQSMSTTPHQEANKTYESNSDSNYLQVLGPPQSEQEPEPESQQESQQQEQQEPVTAMVQLSSSQYLSAVRIGHESEVYDGEIIQEQTDEERIEEERKQKSRRFTTMLVFVLAVTLVLIVGVVASRKQRSRLGGLGESFIDNDTFEEGQASQDPPVDRGQLKDYLVSIFAPISGPDGESVFDRGNRAISIDRFNALNWMLDDLLASDSFSSSTTVVQSKPYLIPEWKLLQRYILALLYFSTHGLKWDIKANFLSGIDECQWTEPTPFEWQKRDPVMQSINENIGVTCNEDGKIQKVHIDWNDLSGTIPEELSYFKDTLEVLSLSGGLISGTIPSSISKLTKLKTLALNDNCLTGAIPEGISSDLPFLERFSVINNGDLSGSLNGFCNGNEYTKEEMLAVASECPMPLGIGDDDIDLVGSSDFYDGLECDCCICCDRNNYDCYDSQSGDYWKSYNLNAKTVRGYAKSFEGDSECRTLANRKWVKKKCPCYVRSSTNITEDGLFAFECAECSQEGATAAFIDWYWLEPV